MEVTQTAFEGIGEARTVRSATCSSCGKTLTNPVSIDAGMGPVCRGKRGASVNGGDRPEVIEDQPLQPYCAPEECGYVWKRGEDGEVQTNVPHHVISHSPTGYEFGYGGSGPADLALNVLQDFLVLNHYAGPKTKCYNGWCYSVAWVLHQDFKRTWVELCDQETGGGISNEDLKTWLHMMRLDGRVNYSSLAMASNDWELDFTKAADNYYRWLARLE